MQVRPNLEYRHANYPSNSSCTTEVQDCILATNQPDWEAEGKIFVLCRQGAPEMLLTKADYTVVVEDRGYYDQHHDKRVCLLHDGDELRVVKFATSIWGERERVVVCEATCHNSGKSCYVEVPIGMTLLQFPD